MILRASGGLWGRNDREGMGSGKANSRGLWKCIWINKRRWRYGNALETLGSGEESKLFFYLSVRFMFAEREREILLVYT